MTLSTRSFPKRKRGLGRVLSKLASRRDNNKKEQGSSRSVEDVKRLLLSDDASQSETSFATDWDASSSSPEHSKHLLQVGEGASLACAMPEPLLQAETENEADELLFAETPTSREDESSSSSSTSADDAMLGMEVNVVPDQAQEQQWHLVDVAVDATSIASPPMIFEDCSTSSSYSSLHHHHHHHHHINHSRSYRSYEGSAASNSIVESVDQAKVTKFTKFLKKAREQQHECVSQQSLAEPQHQHQEQRLPEVHVAMPDIIKPPKASLSSVWDKIVALLVMICLTLVLWKLQQMTPAVA